MQHRHNTLSAILALAVLTLVLALLPSYVLAESDDQPPLAQTPASELNDGSSSVDELVAQAPESEPATLLPGASAVQDEAQLEAQATNITISEQCTPDESEWSDYRISLTPGGQFVINKAFTLKGTIYNDTSYDHAIDVQSGNFMWPSGIFQYVSSNNTSGALHVRSGASTTMGALTFNGGVAKDLGGSSIILIDQGGQLIMNGHTARIDFFTNGAIENNGSLVVLEGSEASFTRDTIAFKGSGTPLTIESGATVEVFRGTITMQDNQGFVVKSGGKLVLDATTIKAAGTRLPVTVEPGGMLEILGGTTFQNVRPQTPGGPATTHLGVQKLWELGEDEPSSDSSVTVRLYAGPSAEEQHFTGATAEVSGRQSWKADLGEWPAYWDNNEQVPAVYTVRELGDDGQDIAPGSKATINGSSYVVSYGEPRPSSSNDGMTELSVTNTHEALSVTLEASKTLVGRELAANEFRFRLLGENDVLLQEKTNDVDGLVVFDPISLPGFGTYTYAVEEVPGNEAGMTYDAARYEVAVTVNRAEGGGFATSVNYTRDGEDVGALAFRNQVEEAEQKSYAPVSVGLEATKTLEGRALRDGEFSFRLDDASGRAVQTKSNDSDGVVRFDALTFEEPGTYAFQVRESEGNPAVSYDPAYHVVTFHVSDAGGGRLVAERTIELDGVRVDALAFRNRAEAEERAYEPVSVGLEATKTLEGRALRDGEFSFQLDDVQGEGVQTKANDAEGAVRFDALSVDKPGTYVWTLREVTGSEAGVTYDTRVYHATAQVEEGSNGSLVLRSLTYTLDGKKVDRAEFSNKYEAGGKDKGKDTPSDKPSDKPSDTPSDKTTSKPSNTKPAAGKTTLPTTGDDSMPAVALLAAALLVSCVGVFGRKRSAH